MKLRGLSSRIHSLPKAELHLHLEGSIQPNTARTLMARHGVKASDEEVLERYSFHDFPGFLETFKWVTSFLCEPQDYALVATDLGERLLEQNVVYVEATLSVGVMLLRKQQAEANFEALLRSTEPFERRGLRFRWVFDAVRQFGAEMAMEVLEAAKTCKSKRIVAFGIGGDELQVPTVAFRGVYQRAAELGLHRLIHAGEVGGPEKIREAIELLEVERVGHGIAAIKDPVLMDLLAERKFPLEICPQSNLRTGALARLLAHEGVRIEDHPLPDLLRHGIPVVLSTDDPALFHTTLREEYDAAKQMGLEEKELEQIREMGFQYAFDPASKRQTT
jgi:adenosine deaminase